MGTGGYVCGPILFVASLLGIPTVIHESNSYPGVTTRLLASRVSKIFIAFDEAKRWLKRTDHVSLIGTPTRDSLGTITKENGRSFFQIAPDKRTLLVFGGSLGAASINDAVLDALPGIQAADIQLIWQTGQSDYERIRTSAGSMKIGWLGPFIDKMEYAFGAADLVVSRSGATTLAELTRVGKPAILIPYPFAAGDHQTHNAQSLANDGAAILIADRDARQNLKEAVLSLLDDPKRLDQMSAASARLGKPKAGQEIAAAVIGMI